jgi:hypothetical protein
VRAGLVGGGDGLGHAEVSDRCLKDRARSRLLYTESIQEKD